MQSARQLNVADVRRSSAASLAPEMRADAAMRVLLLEQLQAIEGAMADASRGIDDGGRLHDLRVAVRRSRALLDGCGDVFPARVRSRFGEAFRWASELTSPLRDLDVLLGAFPGYRAALPMESRPCIDLLRNDLQREREPAWRAVCKGLGSSGWHRRVEAWRMFLESPLPRRPGLADAMRPVSDVAATRIDDALRKVLKRGRRIDAGTPAAALHRLRLKAKRLRYLVEGFRSLYEAAEAAEIMRALKALQDYLGAHQDLDVHAATIDSHAVRIERTGQATTSLPGAVRALSAALLDDCAELRALYPQRFAAFDTPVHLAAFASIAPVSGAGR
jgi:CHAD domain-containing protein